MKTSLYIHIPFCKSKCDYCDFFSIPISQNNIKDDYIDSLINEINFRCKYFNVDSLNTVYIGGGTPSLLTKNQLQKLFLAIFKISKNIEEFSIELNPDDITKELLIFLQEKGISRISVGIQSLQEKVLSFVKRRSSQKVVENALELIKKYWKKEFSLDIISGLPYQTNKDFLSDLKKILQYNPNHISMYSLTIEENTPLEKLITSKKIKYNYDFADKMWILGKKFLQKNGFIQYEISNFFNKNSGFPCKHNLVYWKMQNYIGCGSGATGSIYFKEKNSIRYTNKKNIQNYINFWSSDEINLKNFEKNQFQQTYLEIIDKDTEKFEFLMMNLRTLEGICIFDFKERFNQDFNEKIKKTMQKWNQKKLAKFYQKENKLYFALSDKGILFLNDFLMECL